MSLTAAQGSAVFADAGGWDDMNGWGWGMTIFGWLFMALIIALVVWLVWSTTHQPPSSNTHDGRALRLLDERYARGEIDRDEYLERKADLEH
jgi:putative membrane protein